jgi:hypothetical protein
LHVVGGLVLRQTQRWQTAQHDRHRNTDSFLHEIDSHGLSPLGFRFRVSGVRRNWKMEYWKTGTLIVWKPTIPIFHHSNSPSVSKPEN